MFQFSKIVYILEFFLQLTKQMELAVAEARKPITPPPFAEDPFIEAFGRMVMAAMKKVPEEERLEMQCQVMEVFRNRERKAAMTKTSPVGTVASGSSMMPPIPSYGSDFQTPSVANIPMWSQTMYSDVQQQQTPISYGRWPSQAPVGRFPQQQLFQTSPTQISPMSLAAQLSQFASMPPMTGSPGDTYSTTACHTVTTTPTTANITPITTSSASSAPQRQQQQQQQSNFPPMDTPVLPVRSPSDPQFSADSQEAEVTTTTTTPGTSESVMSLQDFVN